ncbi:aldo/keto reductase [Bradyrhizobium sp. BR 1433]|uniref:aldo/keto reductase n=1 Tax=Bradyrhizobium sp. BR 1433 TaxID=3447967 RepID=UPI003EE46AB2
MEYRNLGASGLKVPVLSFGTGTFGGQGPLFSAWGRSDASEARRLIDICLEAGVNLFDTADVYSNGASEEILGAAIKGRRDRVLISTKTGLPMGDGPLDAGTSRYRLVAAVDAALRRLNTLVRAGKLRYVGASNFSGWHLMKSLGVAERHGWPRYVAHQVYYSLVGRDYESELMPLALDQGVGALVWSPLGWGRLTGKIRRGQPLPTNSRLHETAQFGPPVDDEKLYAIVDALDAVATETGRSVPQIAIAWLLTRPSVSSVIIGARDEAQLRDNLGAVGWSLSADQIARLDRASAVMPAYPYYPYRIQEGFARLNPSPV